MGDAHHSEMSERYPMGPMQQRIVGPGFHLGDNARREAIGGSGTSEGLWQLGGPNAPNRDVYMVYMAGRVR